jgi:hypothetical protein
MHYKSNRLERPSIKTIIILNALDYKELNKEIAN